MLTMEQEAMIIQNLKDAQCGHAVILEFLELWNAGQTKKAFNLLSRHRACLLYKIHETQKPLDNLDYLIHTLKRKGDNL